MDWSLDYCLACDRQTAGEAYCSQTCRLADHETSSGGSELSSPASNGPSTPSVVVSQSPSGFYLPPAFDFSAYRSTIFPVSNPQRTTLPLNLSSSTQRFPTDSEPSPRVLTPSSSRSSLTSIQSSASSQNCLSEQARSELREYTNSFDQVRDWRRRMTSS
ncbi:hypothetical protein MMC09_002029 [Bachmanniomyces sp. S44760]|nr:hypothetical protein [Bachmanniomyces sp. S44760]